MLYLVHCPDWLVVDYPITVCAIWRHFGTSLLRIWGQLLIAWPCIFSDGGGQSVSQAWLQHLSVTKTPSVGSTYGTMQYSTVQLLISSWRPSVWFLHLPPLAVTVCNLFFFLPVLHEKITGFVSRGVELNQVCNVSVCVTAPVFKALPLLLITPPRHKDYQCHLLLCGADCRYIYCFQRPQRWNGVSPSRESVPHCHWRHQTQKLQHLGLLTDEATRLITVKISLVSSSNSTSVALYTSTSLRSFKNWGLELLWTQGRDIFISGDLFFFPSF